MTPNRMLLDVSSSPEKKKKIKQTFNFNLIDDFIASFHLHNEAKFTMNNINITHRSYPTDEH